MNPHEQLIEEFYAAFAAHEPETMASCYHPEIEFHDPVFGTLHGNDVGDMWRMLLSRGKNDLTVEFSGIKADQERGSAKWVARYPFPKTGRRVVNEVVANFVFRDGLIAGHNDDFNFCKWARQAFGITGWLFGNTTFLRNKVREQALSSLDKFRQKQEQR